MSKRTVYMSKQTVDNRFDQLRSLQKEISIAKERANILEAEWAYVTRPDRILTLSSGLLLMRPITSDRILPLEAIPMRRAKPQTNIRTGQ